MTGILNLLAGAVSSAIKDTYFNLTTLLLPGDGTNGAQNNTFLDSSSNAFSITRNGNTTQGTFTPFSQTGWSGYFATGQGLTNASALLSTTANTFTGEAWIYLTAASGSATYPSLISFDGQISSTSLYFAFGPRSDNKLCLYWYDGAAKTAVGGTVLSLNTWYHVACVANAGAIALYVNGVAETLTGTTTLTNRSGTANEFDLIANFYQTNPCYASNLRVSTTARYTGNFTPSTVPFTNDANTKLLTLQSNRFVDNSSTPYTLTPYSTPSVQAFSPFAPTAAYSAATVGGSGYFDGTGDYLTVADNAALELAASNFTIEAWVYPTTTSGTRSIVSKRSSGAVYGGYDMFITTGNVLGFIADDNTTLPWAVEITTGSTVVPNAWSHIAVTRNGSTWTTWVNGVQSATATASITINDQATSVGIGGIANGDQLFTGYITDARIVKGTAVYTGTFTPPRAPISTSGAASASAYSSTTNVNTSFAASETSLLTNYTNAGITDATAKNDLETVGNAQISTTQSKFGGSSMSFDGTGDYLTSNPATTDLYAFGSGDFTIEMWLRLNSVTGTQVFYDQRPLAGGVYPTLYMSGSTLFYYANGANRITGSTLSTNQWYHIAVSRSGTSTRLFVDGTQSGSTYTDTNVYLNAALRPFIGGDGTNLGTNGLNGYIDDLRITRGFARYTANFNVPTVAFPTQ